MPNSIESFANITKNNFDIFFSDLELHRKCGKGNIADLLLSHQVEIQIDPLIHGRVSEQL